MPRRYASPAGPTVWRPEDAEARCGEVARGNDTVVRIATAAQEKPPPPEKPR